MHREIKERDRGETIIPLNPPLVKGEWGINLLHGGDSIAKGVRVNKGINAKEVRLIGPDGKQIGIVPSHEALRKAVEVGLDLVEIAPTATPPVCRIMDFGKYKYEQTKKHHAARQHQKTMQIKEIKIRPHIDEHDLEFKLRNIKKFLEAGNRTKVTMMFRGREMAYPEMGKSTLERIAMEVTDIGTVEHPPRLEGRNMVLVLIPK
ncbi:MAG: translation initiation factor IF-3 [Nitrospirota bacterium]